MSPRCAARPRPLASGGESSGKMNAMVPSLSADRHAGGFLVARWRGRVAADRVFWVDMWLAGTAINIATTFLSLVVLGLKLPLWLSLAVYFAPVPWNVFLVVSLWRACDRQRPAGAGFYRLAALAWLALATLI